MPGSHSEISVDEEGNEHKDRSNRKKKKKKKKNGKGYGCMDELEKGQRVVVPSFSNPKKKLSFKIRRKPISPKPSSSSSGGSKGGCFCIMRPPNTKESSSPTSDPNDENFTHDMLRVLLETNNFSSKECNPHLGLAFTCECCKTFIDTGELQRR